MLPLRAQCSAAPPSRLPARIEWASVLSLVTAFSAGCADGSPTSSPDGNASGGGSTGGEASSGGNGEASGGQSASGGSSGGSNPSGGASPATGGTILSEVPRKMVEYVPSEAILRNPERGFYRFTSIMEEDTLSWVDDNYSLYFSYVRLDDYREADLPAPFLADLESGLAMVRAEGAKLILRFAYNDGPYPDSEPDASLSQILEHIDQLGPILRDNQDIIAVLQAGFIGAWGEWHTSTNGLANPTDKKAVLDALLDEMPVSRSVQVRYPPDIVEFFPMPLTEESAFTGSPQSRTGHHNDCFLASDSDMGTYPSDAEVFKTYLSQTNLFVPMGGETCALNPPRSECATALDEMERLRFSYINNDFQADVVASWETGGCRNEMERRLGYRLELVNWDAPESIAPGKAFVTNITLKNVGFAAPMNPRPVYLLLESGGQTFEGRVDGIEVRQWLPGQERTISASFTAPNDLSNGEATISLWLPDDADSLRDDPRYSIRTANEGTWNASNGANVLGTVTIDPSAEVDEIPSAQAFTAR